MLAFSTAGQKLVRVQSLLTELVAPRFEVAGHDSRPELRVKLHAICALAEAECLTGIVIVRAQQLRAGGGDGDVA